MQLTLVEVREDGETWFHLEYPNDVQVALPMNAVAVRHAIEVPSDMVPFMPMIIVLSSEVEGFNMLMEALMGKVYELTVSAGKS